MEISGSYLLPCSQQRAWDALSDPELLKASLKGCERLEKLSDSDFLGTVATRIGPVSARFAGTMRLENVQAPDSCDMVFEGQGGVVGFARGSAKVTLAPEGSSTRLTYKADTKIGGKLAQMGTRLVEGAARSMADDFFGTFSGLLGHTAAVAPPTPAAVAENAQAPARSRRGWPIYAGVAALVLALALYMAS